MFMAYEYAHGGDIYSYGKKLIDFSANINPLGPPESAKEAYLNSFELCMPYPDYACRKLREAIGQYENVEPAYIFCSCGAADIIYRLVYSMRPQKALITAPSFSEYEEALSGVGCEISYMTLSEEKGFHLTEDILDKMDGCQMVFLCNPNNPTGCLEDFELMKKIVEKADALHLYGFCGKSPSIQY